MIPGSIAGMSDSDSVEIIVIGAGVVGLAVARALAVAGREVIVIERHAQPGQEISSRNSGVIHSGIYYPGGSLKARMCVRGRELLYAYCAERDIAHRRCGKIIVASGAQVEALQALHRRGLANGVHDLDLLTERQVHELEPAVRCAAGLLSPSTGIIDVHEFMTALEGDLEHHGGGIVFNTEALEINTAADGLKITTQCAGERSHTVSRHVINSAGLHATSLLRCIASYPAKHLRTAYYAKGNYYVCRGTRPFQRLVYPMPNEAGLGVHATLGLDGSTRFGPDVEWIDAPDYQVDPARSQSFYAAIREYWPALPADSLYPDYAGVRPKLVGPGMPAADFEIEGPDTHGINGLVNLLGIESPGLTSALAIAEQVAQQVV